MRKHSLLPGFISIVVLLAIAGALLFPLGTGLSAQTGAGLETAIGYDFVFGNKAILINTPHPAAIAAFVILIIAAFFGLLAAVLGFFGGKVGAFLNILTGLLCLVPTIIFFVSPFVLGQYWLSKVPHEPIMLGWGYILAGSFSAIASLLGLIFGFKGMLNKKA